MRVLLAYPHRDDIYHKVGFVLPPMGLAYTASALQNAGHDVTVRDFNVNRAPIDMGAFDMVGISMDTSRFKSGLGIAREAKQSGCTVMAGGPHVSFMDEEALSTGVIDYVVRGEGEETAVELLSAVQSGDDVSPVRGISYLKDGKLRRNEDRGFIADLEDLRPARELLDMHLYRSLEMGKRKMTSVLTSRGCPYSCSFCSSTELSGRRWRARSPESVVGEVAEVVSEYGFNGIAFLDDNFTSNPARVIQICKGLIDRKLDVYWWCFSRADILLRNEEMVRSMAEAGCRYIFIGFESRAQETLDGFGKGIREDMAVEVVRLLKKNKIGTHASFIIGDVSETREMVMDTIKYARSLDPEAVQFTILTPYPGTRLFAEVRDRIETYDWDLYDCLHPVLRLDHLSNKDMASLLKTAYIKFYLSPRKIMAGLLSGLRGKGIKLGSIMRILRSTR